MMKQVKPTFEVDKKGLSKILAKKGRQFALLELFQNSVDEDGVTEVEMGLRKMDDGRYEMFVEDNSPEGFKDLTHAYTLFAESAKKGRADQRGRFNLGEKLVIAICDYVQIGTTKGIIEFTEEGRIEHPPSRDRGSKFLGLLQMTDEEASEAEAAVDTLLVPGHIRATFNGRELEKRIPVKTFEATLRTEMADGEGNLRPTTRKTKVSVYEPRMGETAMLYEMGIPVVETGDRWHVDIAQKVPLNTDRDNVPPGWLRDVRVEVLNNCTDLLSPEATKERWVSDAIEDEKVAPEALMEVVKGRYGDKAVIEDRTDPEGTKIAITKGYCMPESTECLTPTGWRKPHELWEGELTLGFNAETGMLEWTPIQAVHRFEALEMVEVASGSWSAVCTPDHRWSVEKRRDHGRAGRRVEEDGLRPLCELTTSHRIRLAAPAVGGASGITPQEAAIIAWIACDGHVTGGWMVPKQVAIFQGKPSGLQEIERLLVGVPHGRSVRERPNTNWPSHTFRLSIDYARQLISRAGITGGGWLKFVTQLDREARAAFLKACYDAEGHNTGSTSVFTQKAGSFNEAVRLAIYMDGRRPGHHGPERMGVNKTSACKPGIWADSLKRSAAPTQAGWCPQTGLGSWTARTADGQIMLTGNTVIPGGAFSKTAWKNVKQHQTVKPAGQVTPSPNPNVGDGDLKLMEPDHYPQPVRQILEMTSRIAKAALGIDVEHRVVTDVTWPFAATYGKRGPKAGKFTWNYGRLGHAFFKQGMSAQVLSLVIHELAHHTESDHLAERYYEACCSVGAEVALALAADPSLLEIPDLAGTVA